MMMSFDIETAANELAPQYWGRKTFEAPSNWKDPEKIKQAVEEKRFEAFKRSGLFPWTGRVTCVVTFDGENVSKFYGEDEKKLLSQFGIFLNGKRTVLVGKNSKTFDVPFLVGRYIAHDLGVPDLLRPTREPKDIDECFGYSSQSIRGSLSDYAWLMGIDGKLSHGSNAQAMFDATAIDQTKWDELVDYCARDVQITHEFLRRYMKPFLAALDDSALPFTEQELPF